jgi:small subunit ribosomal protein S20
LANIKSAIKRIRSSKRKQIRNQAVRTHARTRVKAARLAIDSGNPTEAVAAIQAAYSALDRAAIKGTIHRRNAARRKSRLMKKLARATATEH